MLKKRVISCKSIKVTLLLFILCLTAFIPCGGCTQTSTVAGSDEPYIGLTGKGIKRETKVTLAELKEMEAGLVEEQYFSLNSYGTRAHTRFKGVRVWYIIQQVAALRDSAATVSFSGEDGYRVSYTLEEVQRDDYLDETDPSARLPMILAWEEEGSEFAVSLGNPFQLVVGQKEPGDINKPYWVRNVRTIIID